MASKTVHCTRTFSHSIEALWSWVGDYFGDWHPAIKTCARHCLSDGRELRRFEGTDGGLYEEALLTYSAADRSFSYQLTAGIPGLQSYIGSVHLSAEDKNLVRLTWQAEIMMEDEGHLENVAKGTTAIFEAGFDWLEAHGQSLNLNQSLNLKMSSKASSLANQHGKPHRLSIGEGSSLSYLECAKNDATTLVLFLHGIGGNATNWLPQLSGLGDRHWLAALDIRGYGGSTLGDDASTIEDYCNDIVKIFTESKAKKLILVGLSMGSWIAASFAMRYPKLLEGLVFAGGCTGMSEAPPEIRENFRKSRSKPLLSGQTTADMAEDVVKVICGPSASPEVREEMANSMSAISNETYLDALRCFCAPTETFDFTKISCPVLMMTGRHDKLAPPEEISSVSRRIATQMTAPDMRYEVLENAGHICNLEDAERFNAYLETFLDRFASTQDSPSSQRKAEKKQAKRRLILNAALDAFSNNGYDGVSMDHIAKEAKVSKPTLYQYFGDKDQLFNAVLAEGSAHILSPLETPKDNLVDQLWDFSWTYADYVLMPEMLSLARLILGEAMRRPDSAEAYYQQGPGNAFKGIYDFVKSCVQQDLLEVEDIGLAAENLWSLILSGQRDYHLHYVHAEPDRTEIARVIHHGLRVFLKIYSTNTKADLQSLEDKYEEFRKGQSESTS